MVNNQNIIFDILDTAGKEEFSSMHDLWIQDSNFFLVCFAINSVKSFNDALLYRERILHTKDDDNNWGMMLVATKCDLRTDEIWIENNSKEKYPQRFIDKNIILEKSNEWNVPYIETSSKCKKNVDFMFYQCLYECWIQSQTQCLNTDKNSIL